MGKKGLTPTAEFPFVNVSPTGDDLLDACIMSALGGGGKDGGKFDLEKALKEKAARTLPNIESTKKYQEKEKE